MKKNHY